MNKTALVKVEDVVSEDVILVYGPGLADDLWRIWWAKRQIDRAAMQWRERTCDRTPKREPVMLEALPAPSPEPMKAITDANEFYDRELRRLIFGACVPTGDAQ